MGRNLVMAIDPGDAKAAGNVCYGAAFADGALSGLYTLDRDSARQWRVHAGCGPDVVVIEKPQMDRRSRKVSPKILIGLAWNGALVAGALDPDELVALTPSEWKGSVNKAPHHMRIWRALAADERCELGRAVKLTRKKAKALEPDDVHAMLRAAAVHYVETGNNLKHAFYDLLDAVGLGLRYHGRIGGP